MTTIADQAPRLVDCGECRTQGCPAGKCRNAVPAQTPAQAAEPVDLEGIIADHLTAMYVCTRVWHAWSVGTMTEGDFVPAGETEFVTELAAAIRVALAAPRPSEPAATVEAQPWTQADADAWGERHDLRIHGHDLFCAFEDAATTYLTRAGNPSEPAATGRVPLSREQIRSIMTEHYPLDSLLPENVDAFEACVRDIERAHTIPAPTGGAAPTGAATGWEG